MVSIWLSVVLELDVAGAATFSWSVIVCARPSRWLMIGVVSYRGCTVATVQYTQQAFPSLVYAPLAATCGAELRAGACGAQILRR